MKLPTIPSMKCDPDCGECCGPVPVTEKEYQAVLQFAREKGIKPVEQGQTCPFLIDKKCSVYEVRPLVCKLYGHTPKMTCPRGYNVNMRESEVKKLNRLNGPPRGLLHQALVAFGVVEDSQLMSVILKED